MRLPISTSPARFGLGYSLLCPCVGDGAAFAELAADVRERSNGPVRIYACEIDRTRWRKAGTALRRVDRSATVLRGDANRLAWPASGDAVDLLYLDPPRNGHEVGWLKRFTPALAKTGALALVVRAEQLARQERDKPTLASYLATAYLDHALFRLPDGRVLVVAGKSVTNRHTAREENRIAAAARAPGQLPVPADATGALTLIASDRQFRLHLRAVSVESALQQWQPLADAGVGLEEVDAGRAFGNVYPTAMPPKPAHIALALASGQFNGHELQPNDTAPATWPPVVLKGSYARTRFTVQVDNDKDGKPKRITEADRPSFTMRAIALDDYRVIAPQDSAALTGTANLDEASVADVVEHYSEALGALMASQFPALHDPGNPEHAFELPSTSHLRTPYACQESRIRAALKLIAKGQNPKLMEDVGVGKSLQSLTAAAALSPQYHARTQQALRAVPGWQNARLPTVRRVLVVCPPHMVSTWQDEAALAWPSARVVQLDRMGDEHQDAEIYLVTKERAKLGHGEEEATVVWGRRRMGANSRVFGPLGSRLRSPAMRPDVHPRCPRCNTIPPPGAKRCKHSERVPTNDFARILPRLALALLPSLPQELTIREVAGRHRIALFAADRQNGMVRPPRAGEAAAIIRLLLAASMVAFDVRGSGWDEIFVAVRSLALAAGIREEAARALRETAAEINRTQSEREDGRPGRWVEKQADLMPQWPREEIAGHARTCWDIVRKLAEWEREPSPECGESLVQAVPAPRRYPLASHLLRKARRRFDLVILDEAHEAANSGTQQQLAMHRLAMLPCPTILLSGTMMTGYASSLWETWWASDADFRAAYGRRGKGAFLRQFGLRRHRKERPAKVVAGQPWPEKAVGEEPSVVPSFILRHVLPTAVLLHKSDLDSDLPPLREHPAPLTGGEDHRDRELLAAADELAVAVADRIEEDAGTELEGMLWGAMGEVTSYLDRCHAPFVARYPESVGGEVVATGKLFDPSYIAPKERYLIHLLRRLVLREDRKVLVYLRHVGGHLPERLAGLIRQHVDPAGAYLSSKSPPPAKRRERIEEMLADGARWIVVNPEAVQTGLNCLVACSATVWMEPPRGTAKTWVQANGRVHRIGQTRPVDCYLPFYQGSIQEVSVPHVARKISAIQRVNGQSMQAALEAAGAGVDEREAAEAAMRFGRAVFERAMRRKATIAVGYGGSVE